uniref:Itga4 protein n=1 Tax=Fopius arisanus TaxID=64838 RepID=A0A0C9S078_9HYME
MILTVILFILRGTPIWAYNIHEKPSLMLQDSTFSYFGYSILLHAQHNHAKSWLIVGAPKSKLASVAEPGLVYKYNLQLEKSQPVRIQPKELTEEKDFISSVNHDLLIRKDYGWFGASMSIDPGASILTVCAPRTMITLYSSTTKFQSMHGVCYSGNITADRLELDDQNFANHDFTSEFWYNPIHGFSVHYPMVLAGTSNAMITGSPREELVGSVFIKGQSRSVYMSKLDDNSMFGYAVSSGYFFNRQQLLYAGSAPGFNLVGWVAIVDPTTNPGIVLAEFDGTMIGEFFGGSLAACDLNNDGLDEIIIGAPHWGQDHGRVYIYLGNSESTFEEADVILNGYKEGSFFGYSLSCGDLDMDDFDDLIVGAPWEDNGVVYIFNGDSSLKSKFEIASQKITVTSPAMTFGFSLAKPVDIDFNGFPDLAIGAFKSNYAMVLNSRPVVKSNVRVTTIPSSLDTNSTFFIVQICVNHTRMGSLSHESFDLTINIDENLNRVKKSQLFLSYPSWSGDTETTVCFNQTANLTETILNYIDPIPITVIHTYGNFRVIDNGSVVACSLCPMEHDGSSKSHDINISFKIGCGEDEICTSLISITGSFHYASNGRTLENNTWIVGSKDINLQVILANTKEPAYSAVLVLTLPKNTFLRSILDSCKEEVDNGIVKVICALNNPLVVNQNKTLIFDLNMNEVNNGSLDGTNLTFTARVTTRSRQLGDSVMVFPVFLRSNASLTLEGHANERNYDLPVEFSAQNISFEHLYKISKFGFTPVPNTKLIVKVPYRVKDRKFLAITNAPMITVSGKSYRCYTHDVPVIQNKQHSFIRKVIGPDETDKSELNAHSNLSRLTRSPDSFLQSLLLSNVTTLLNNTARFFTSATPGPNLRTVNCSSTNVQCGTIICKIAVLSGDHDSTSLRLQYSISISQLMGDEWLNNDGHIIEFISEAWVDIQEPVNWAVRGIGNVTKVTTTFIKINPPRRVNVWIIVGCILLGLLALFLIAIGLRQMGFFPKTKERRDE